MKILYALSFILLLSLNTNKSLAQINTVEHYTNSVDSYLRGLNEKNL